MHRLVDGRVGHLRRELASRLLEGRPLHVGQQPARDVVVVGSEPLHLLRVLARVAHEARRHVARRAHRPALVARERLVGVLGQGNPERPSRDPGPAPLPLVPVPVADHEIEQTRLHERSTVDAVVRAALAPLLPQVEGRHDLGDALVPGGDVLVEGADGAAEGLLELPERRVVRHHREARAVEGDPHRLRQRADDRRGRGVRRRGLVDGDGSKLTVLPLLRQHALGVLLQLAEGVAAAVRALHGQAFRLEPADLGERREAARLGLEVEHRQGNGRRPGLAVTVPEPVPPLSAAVELLAGDDRPGFRPGRRGGRGRCRLLR